MKYGDPNRQNEVRGATQVGDRTLNYRYSREFKVLKVWSDDVSISQDVINFLKARGYEYNLMEDNWTVNCPTEGLLSHMLPGHMVTR